MNCNLVGDENDFGTCADYVSNISSYNRTEKLNACPCYCQVQMDEWADEYMDRWSNRWIDGLIDSSMDRWSNRWIDGLIDSSMDRWTERCHFFHIGYAKC